MHNWDARLRLFAVLAATRAMIARSTEEGWGLEKPEQAGADLDQIIDAIFCHDSKGLPKHWTLLYAPTGPLQEIAMANGWSDAYMKLAAEYDDLQFIMSEYEASPNQRPQ